MKRVQLVDVRSVHEMMYDLLFHSADMPQKERRQKLIDAMKAPCSICRNISASSMNQI